MKTLRSRESKWLRKVTPPNKVIEPNLSTGSVLPESTMQSAQEPDSSDFETGSATY